MKRISPWRAAINWYGAVFFFGSLVATVFPTVLFLGIYCVIYGIPPPAPSWLVMRLIQLGQAVVISAAGGYLALRYFRSRFAVTYAEIRRPMQVLAAAVPATCLLIIVGISIPKYGVTGPLVISSILIFGTFTLLFLAASFHFARKLP